jgi:TonB family protein
MMRKALLATLALSPVLLHAQANSPAQPQASGSNVLESRLISPKEIGSSADRSSTAPNRISTGVIAPKLVHVVDISSSGEDWAWQVSGIERMAVVSMLVDENGVPSNLKIVRSVGADMDNNVLAAVKQYRFQPGTLNHQPTAFPVNLEVVIRSTGR